MIDLSCPWCEAQLGVPLEVEADEQTCPECLTTWTYELSMDIALAA